MCDCIKYKDFFAADEINHIQLLKEELSLNETARFGTPEQEKEIVSLYTDKNNPLNAVQIAKQFNVSNTTIARILVRNGVTIRDRKKLTPEQEKEIVSLYTDTPLSAVAIASRFNVTSVTIADILVRNGVTRRDQSTSKMLQMIIPGGMTPTDYEIYKKIKFPTIKDRTDYLSNYRVDKKQCIVCGNPAQQNSNGVYRMFCKKHLEQKRYKSKHTSRKNKNDAVFYKGGKCIRCGYNKSNAALDFHHVDKTQKDKNWSALRLKPLEQLKNELDKCELLCKNCHAVVDKEGVSITGRHSKQKKLACLEYKKTKECTKCGFAKDRRALSFHHVDPSQKDKNFKTFVGWLEWRGWQPGQELPDRIKKEMDKCVVLCKNCHAEEHYNPSTDDVTDEYYKEIPEEECTDDNCKHSH
jgi:ribosomal protein L37E